MSVVSAATTTGCPVFFACAAAEASAALWASLPELAPVDCFVVVFAVAFEVAVAAAVVVLDVAVVLDVDWPDGVFFGAGLLAA
jgi:hypothetical protein